jgi:hypothetical protein
MSQVNDLQGIARRLAAAGYVEHPANEGVYLLHVDGDDTTEYTLICRHWTGYTFESEELVYQPVRQNTPAAYLITPVLKRIVCITPSSTLCILEYSDDEEEWVTDSILRHTVHRNGKIAACVTEGKRLHIFFQDSSESLVYLDINGRTSATIPARLAVGSPIYVDVFNGKTHIFYIDGQDHRIHFVVMTPGKVPTDHMMSTCKLKEGLQQFTVILTPGEGSFSAYALTEGRELLHISGDGGKTVLGTVDAAGGFVSGRAVDRCCAEAWDGTLVADRLKGYLKNDPYFINSAGGEHDITPLAAAVWKGHLDIVKLLLNYGADSNALSPKNRSPLFYATTRSPPENRSAIVRALLRAGAEVDQCHAEDNFNTPLMNAITLFRDKDVVHELLTHGASLTIQNGDGRTAGMLVKGTDLEKELPQLREQPLVNPGPLSPPQSRQGSGEFEKRLIEFLIPLLLLIVSYFKAEDVLDEILMELGGVEGLLDKASSIEG